MSEENLKKIKNLFFSLFDNEDQKKILEMIIEGKDPMAILKNLLENDDNQEVE